MNIDIKKTVNGFVPSEKRFLRNGAGSRQMAAINNFIEKTGSGSFSSYQTTAKSGSHWTECGGVNEWVKFAKGKFEPISITVMVDSTPFGQFLRLIAEAQGIRVASAANQPEMVGKIQFWLEVDGEDRRRLLTTKGRYEPIMSYTCKGKARLTCRPAFVNRSSEPFE